MADCEIIMILTRVFHGLPERIGLYCKDYDISVRYGRASSLATHANDKCRHSD
jgi:hypothetical protein